MRGDDFSGCGASRLDGRRGETLMATAELLGGRTRAEALVGGKGARGRAAAPVTRGVGSRDATVWSESGQRWLRWRCLGVDENKAFWE